MAANDLCAVADVQAFLGLPAGQDTALLQTLVTNCSAIACNYMQRQLLSATYTETYDGTTQQSIPLRNTPITAVSAVSVNGVAIQPAPDSMHAGYLFSDKLLYLSGYSFVQGFGTYTFAGGPRNVTVTYTAGYATVPADVNQAVIEMVATKYKRRTQIGIAAQTLNGETISYSQSDIPPSAKVVLDSYRRVYPT